MPENLTSRQSVTPPKEGIDASVGREMGRDYGWLLRRTKRVEELLAQPRVMEFADRIAIHMEKYCDLEEVRIQDVETDILPTQSKKYITIKLGK